MRKLLRRILAIIREGKMPSEMAKSEQGMDKRSYDQSLLSLLESTRLVDCLKVYTTAMPGSELEKQALEKIKKLARSFDDWLMIFQSVSPVSSLGILSLSELASAARTFEEWHTIHIHCEKNPVSLSALGRMAVLAHSKEEQVIVYGLAPAESQLKTSMFGVLKSQVRGFEDWEALLDSSEGELAKFAATIVIDLAPEGDLESIAGLLSHSAVQSDPDLTEKVLGKLRTAVASFDDWVKLYGNAEDDDVKQLALSKLIDGIDSVDRLIAVEEAVQNDDQDDAFDKLFKPKAQTILVTDDACRRIVENYYAEGSLFVTAFEWLLGQATDTRGCFDLYVSLLEDWKTEGGETSDMLLEKTTEKMLSVANQTEMLIMSKLSDDFGDLSSEAKSRLVKK